jgi:hypothetical protein
MLAVCPKCADIHEGIGTHCRRCFSDVLTRSQRKSSLRASVRLCTTSQQRELLVELTRPMGFEELQEWILRMVDLLDPVERTVLVEVGLAVLRQMPLNPP